MSRGKLEANCAVENGSDIRYGDPCVDTFVAIGCQRGPHVVLYRYTHVVQAQPKSISAIFAWRVRKKQRKACRSQDTMISFTKCFPEGCNTHKQTTINFGFRSEWKANHDPVHTKMS